MGCDPDILEKMSLSLGASRLWTNLTLFSNMSGSQPIYYINIRSLRLNSRMQNFFAGSEQIFVRSTRETDFVSLLGRLAKFVITDNFVEVSYF